MINFDTQIAKQLKNFKKPADPPGVTWRALVKLFASLDFTDKDHIWMGAEAVYGWMPYMFDRVEPFPEFLRLVRTLRRLCGPHRFGQKVFDPQLAAEALEILRRSEKQTPYLLTAVKTLSGPSGTTYSVVGTSKFLHFLVPSVVPIWDSRVSKSVGKKSPSLSPNSYLRYVAAIHSIAQRIADEHAIRIPKQVQNVLERDNSGLWVPLVRQIEYCLFL
jgi:hypothetical protein